MTSDAQLPSWFEQEPEHLRPILIELRKLRRSGIPGLKPGRSGVERLLSLGRRLTSGASGQSQYKAMRGLFERLREALSETDRNALGHYFDIHGKYVDKAKPTELARKETAKTFHQTLSKFRGPGGQERPFLMRVAQAIYDLENLTAKSSRQIFSDEINELLTAQVVAGRSLPYWPFDVSKPMLNDVYIAQELKQNDTLRPEVTNIYDVLREDRHALVIGAPGIGKTTLAVQTVARTCERLLDGAEDDIPLRVPLYVPARLLVDVGAMHKALSFALNAYLKLGLSGTLEESLFKKRPTPCVGWTIFLDAIDEIVSLDDRRLLIGQVANYIKSHPRDDSLRFILLGRKLNEEQYEPLKHVGAEEYEIKPFDDGQVDAFIRAWVKSHPATAAAVQTFKDRLVAVKVLDAIRIPLLAALTLVSYDGNQPQLPITVPAIFECFINTLLHERQRNTKSLTQISNHFSIFAGRAGIRIADWLYLNRQQLCAYLAHQTLQGDKRSLVTVADEWIRCKLQHLPFIPEWERQIGNILLDTGLIVRQGDSMVFLHRTIAEYLAASVAGIPAPVDEYEGWASYEMSEGRYHSRTFLLFRLLAWAKKNNPLPLVNRLCERGRDGIDVLEEIVTSGLALDDAMMRDFVRSYIAARRDERMCRKLWEDKNRRFVYKFNTQYIRLLDLLARQYPDLAELVLFDEYEKYHEREVDMRAIGLISLWRLGHEEFVKSHLYRVEQAAKKKHPYGSILLEIFLTNVAEVYVEIGVHEEARRLFWELYDTPITPGEVSSVEAWDDYNRLIAIAQALDITNVAGIDRD